MPYFPSSGLKSFNTELVFLPRFVRHMEGICGQSLSQAHACMFKYAVNTLGTLCRKHVSWGALFVWSVGLSAASIPATCPGQYSTHTTVYHSISQYTTVYYIIPQYIAVYHSILQYITVYHSILQYTTVYYSILQYITVYHSILQYTVVYSDILWYTAIYCNTLIYHSIFMHTD